MRAHLKRLACGLNYSRDVQRHFSPLDSGGGADDWAIHWLIRTDGEVNKLHTQVIAAFYWATEENGGR